MASEHAVAQGYYRRWRVYIGFISEITCNSRICMPRNCMSTNKKLINFWTRTGWKICMGKYRRTDFSAFSLFFKKRSQFCLIGLINFRLLAIQWCNSQRYWRNFGLYILGTEKNHFFQTLLHWISIQRTNLVIFGQLCNIVSRKRKAISILSQRFHTLQTFFSKLVWVSSRLRKLWSVHSRDWKLPLFHLPVSFQIFTHKPACILLLLSSF